jgi:hypothetical protein
MPFSSMQKRYLFEMIVVALLTAFFAFVMYANLHYPGGAWPNPWPLWLRYAIPGWFMANLLATAWLHERMLRDSVAHVDKASLAHATAWHIAVGFGVCWLLITSYVVTAGLKGKLPLDRAIAPAFFLLIFTGFFIWAIHLAECHRT